MSRNFLPVGKYLKLLSGSPFSSKYFSSENGFPLIRIRDIQDSKIETFYTGPYFESYVIKNGDILIGMDGDFHVVKWQNSDGLLNQRILKVEVNRPDIISLRYIYYWLLPYIKKINQVTAATTVKHLSVKDLQKASGHFPDVKKQEKVAEILETLDYTIKKTEALIHKYQQIKQGLMYDLFTRGVTPDGKLRPRREKAPGLYKKTPIGWIPKEWELKPLTTVATYQHGRPFPSTEYSTEGVILLRPGNLHNSGLISFDEAHTTRIPKHWLKKCRSYIVKFDDILMNLTAQSTVDPKA